MATWPDCCSKVRAHTPHRGLRHSCGEETPPSRKSRHARGQAPGDAGLTGSTHRHTFRPNSQG